MANNKPTTSTQKKEACSSNQGFKEVSKTTITTLINSRGVKRTIRETTSAPGARKQSTISAAPKINKQQSVTKNNRKLKSEYKTRR